MIDTAFAPADPVPAWRRRHGRAPRVLHVGNIANNAYLNAKLLRAAGVDADVLCADYYHAMGTPEWEEADVAGDYGSDDLPDWRRVDLGGYRRPDWFIQGPSAVCLAYLRARQQGDGRKTALLQRVLELSRRPRIRRAAEPLLALRRWGRAARHRRTAPAAPPPSGIHARAAALREAFVRAFPGRADRPEAADLVPLVAAYAPFASILPAYDVVHAYATQGLLPLVADRPYVVYEHGTIRALPFQPDPLWQLCALSYRAAARVFVTNADAMDAVRRLGLERVTFVPHPVNEEHLAEDEVARDLRREVRQQLDADFIVFHPSRQDWTPQRDPVWEKANDVFLRGFARFVREVNPRAALVLVRWGRCVAETEQLAASLDLVSRIRWVRPQPARAMVRWMHAADVVADQFLVGTFGAITPKALACGRAAMLKLDEQVHRWCFPEPPPVVNAGDERAVFEQLCHLYRHPDARAMLEAAGRAWYRRYHSNEVVRARLLEGYGDVAGAGSFGGAAATVA